MTTAGAPGSYVTPNTAEQTAVMWGYVSCSVAVYKYRDSAAEHCRYVPPDTPGNSRFFHHSMCEVEKVKREAEYVYLLEDCILFYLFNYDMQDIKGCN